MSRQSSRKVKLTSKFEEFTTSSRLGQRLAHQSEATIDSTTNNDSISSPTKPEKVAKLEKDTKPQLDRANIEIEPSTPIVNSKTNNHSNNQSVDNNNSSSRLERTTTKPTRQRIPPPTPVTPTPIYTTTPSTTPTPYSQSTPLPRLTVNGKVRGRPRKHIIMQKAETCVKPSLSTREELLRLREENVNLRDQLSSKVNEFEELKRQSSYTGQTVPKIDYDDLKEKYYRDLARAKRRVWCYVCLNPAKYYCCWNTHYCSTKCQASDWYERHDMLCRRVLNKSIQN